MAKQLFKLAFSATTNTQTRPTVNNYLTKLSAQHSGASLSISASKFFDNNGDAVATNGLVKKSASNGYYMLFVGGVLQQTALYTVSSAKLTITASSSFTINASNPITLSVANFAPHSSTVVNA